MKLRSVWVLLRVVGPGVVAAIAGLAVYPDGFQSVANGLRQSYSGGRKALAKAFASGSDEDFHEWRKALPPPWPRGGFSHWRPARGGP